MSKKPLVVVKVQGGIVHLAAAPRGVEVVALDYDTDGATDQELCRCRLAGADAPHIHRTLTREG